MTSSVHGLILRDRHRAPQSLRAHGTDVV